MWVLPRLPPASASVPKCNTKTQPRRAQGAPGPCCCCAGQPDAATWPTQHMSWSICVHLVTSTNFNGSVFQIFTVRIDGRAQNKPPDILKPLGLLSSFSSQLKVSQGNKVRCSNARVSARRSPRPQAEQAKVNGPGIPPKSRERTAQVVHNSFALGADRPARPEPGVPGGIKASTRFKKGRSRAGCKHRLAPSASPEGWPLAQSLMGKGRAWPGSPWGSAPCLPAADVPPAIHGVSGGRGTPRSWGTITRVPHCPKGQLATQPRASLGSSVQVPL